MEPGSQSKKTRKTVTKSSAFLGLAFLGSALIIGASLGGARLIAATSPSPADRNLAQIAGREPRASEVTPPTLTQKELLKSGSIQALVGLPAEAYNLALAPFGDFRLLAKLDEDYDQKKRGNTPFDIFRANLSRMQKPADDFAFPFLNDDASFEDLLQTEFGLCAGLTLALRRMNLLAYYQPRAKPKGANGRPLAPESAEFETLIKDRIDSILLDKTAVFIPGFRNLKDLASDPRFNTHIRKHTIRLWAQAALSLRGLDQLVSTQRRITKADADKLYEDLHYRVNDLGTVPVVSLARPSGKLLDTNHWIHVMNVVGLGARAEDGSFEVRLWDVNQPPKKALKLIQIRPNSNGGPASEWSATYQAGDRLELKLAHVGIVLGDDQEQADMIAKSMEFCVANRGLCTKPK
jgi:hypothetical protein